MIWLLTYLAAGKVKKEVAFVILLICSRSCKRADCDVYDMLVPITVPVDPMPHSRANGPCPNLVQWDALVCVYVADGLLDNRLEAKLRDVTHAVVLRGMEKDRRQDEKDRLVTGGFLTPQDVHAVCT